MMTERSRHVSRGLQLHWGSRFRSNQDVTWHVHPETEIVAVTRGHCRIRVGETKILEGTRGTVFVLPANVPQFQETLRSTQTTYIGFEASSGSFDEQPRTFHPDSSDPALQWIEQLCDSHRARPRLSPEVIRCLLSTLLRRVEDWDLAAGSHGQRHPAVSAAQAHLEAHLNRQWTLPEIARAAGVSASHLGALFAAEFGVGPLHYLQQQRMERACWLLSNPYVRVHEVAEACGYDDANYFTRLFSRSLGISPARWRLNRRRLADGKR